MSIDPPFTEWGGTGYNVSLAESATSTPILHFLQRVCGSYAVKFCSGGRTGGHAVSPHGGGLCPGPVGEAVSRRGLPDVHPGPLRGHPLRHHPRLRHRAHRRHGPAPAGIRGGLCPVHPVLRGRVLVLLSRGGPMPSGAHALRHGLWEQRLYGPSPPSVHLGGTGGHLRRGVRGGVQSAAVDPRRQDHGRPGHAPAGPCQHRHRGARGRAASVSDRRASPWWTARWAFWPTSTRPWP